MTDRQRRFIELILADPGANATRAAREAGYTWPGKQGPRLMATVGIGDVVRAGIRRRCEDVMREARERWAREAAERSERLAGLPRERRRQTCM